MFHRERRRVRLPPLVAHAVPTLSPTTEPTVVTTPLIRGLELHLPAHTTIRDRRSL